MMAEISPSRIILSDALYDRLGELLHQTQGEYDALIKQLPKEIQTDLWVGVRKGSPDIWEEIRVKYRLPEAIVCMCLARAIQQFKNAAGTFEEERERLLNEKLGVKPDISLVRTRRHDGSEG
jgi:hypothetical protein